MRIVALTEGIAKNISLKNIPEEKIVLITNGFDQNLFDLHASKDQVRFQLRREMNWQEKFVCMYMGAHGEYNALNTILDAAVVLKNNPSFLFVLIGDGDDKSKLQSRKEKQNLLNVLFLPPVERSKAPTFLSSADVFILPNRRGDFFKMNLPNKLFDFLASGYPVIVAGDGESADLVNCARAGNAVEAENGLALAQAIESVAHLDKKDQRAMGEAGRKYVLLHYTRDSLSKKFLKTLLDSHALWGH